MRKLLPLFILLLTACAAGSPGSGDPTNGEGARYEGLKLEELGAYHATFLLRFQGDYEWIYRLDTRADGTTVERLLHMEGVRPAQNPGDIRLVSQNGINQMRGPGTEEICVQYPADIDRGPTFLTPDDLLAPASLSGRLEKANTETLEGMTATRYFLRDTSLAGWQNPQVDIWRDAASGAVLRYDLKLEGGDPLFDAGQGELTGLFLVNAVEPQQIEPIAGCEVDLPLMENAYEFVKLPGLLAYRSPSGSQEAVEFYQSNLAALGWEPLGAPEIGVDAVLLSFQRGAETLDIHIENRRNGIAIELLMEE